MSTQKEKRQLLNPEIIHKISNINLAARLVAEGFISGRHKSVYHGFSLEFAEHREYVFGDDLKHIDWKVYSKTDKHYIKLYEEETSIKAYLLVDISNSMGYQSENNISKLDYSRYLAAALAYIIIKQQDQVGLVTFAEQIKDFIPPRSTVSHLRNIMAVLQNTTASSLTQLPETLHIAAERIKRRGLIIIFSDLLDHVQEVILGLRHFKNKQHDLIVFHVLDEQERNFDFQHLAHFEDLETKEKILVDPKSIKKEYLNTFNEFIQKYKQSCGEAGIDYVPITTSVPFDFALMSYLSMRQKLG